MTVETRENKQYINWMEEALNLAKKGGGHVAPNPMVGALVIKDNHVVGSGYHMRYGEGHAEVNAVADAKKAYSSLKGMTMVVTLEPCSHTGKTPPCSQLIIREGITKVIIGMKDPNPLVAGRGIKQLEAAGIEVVIGILEEKCKVLNEAFLHHIKHKSPFVTMKTAMTLDGKIATSTGDSRWVSGQASRDYVHRMRQELQGIMVGVNTVLVDDPSLTTRLSDQDKRTYQDISHPIPIIIDSKGRCPLECKLLSQGDHKEVIIGTTDWMPKEKKAALERLGCRVIVCQTDGQHVDLNDLMKIIGEEGINSILLEGGGTLNDGALRAGIVQKVISFIAPKIIGGDTAKTPVAGRGIGLMKDAITLESVSYKTFDKDLCITGYISDKKT